MLRQPESFGGTLAPRLLISSKRGASLRSLGVGLSVLLTSASAWAHAGPHSRVARLLSEGPVGQALVFSLGTGSAATAVDYFRTEFPAATLAEAAQGQESAEVGLPAPSSAQVRRLRLTEGERQAFDSDWPLLNSLREEALRRGTRFAQRNAGATDQAILLFVRAEWFALAQGNVQAESLVAVRKLSDEAISQIK